MKIDVSTIEGFDAMSADEKLNALLSLDIPDADEITKLKGQVSKANSEVAEWKRRHNSLLSEDEQKQNEAAETLKNLQTELETLRKEKAVSGFTAKLLENGFTSEEASKGATALADGNIDQFFNSLSAYRTNMEKSIKANLMKNNQAPSQVGGVDSIMTREKYDKLSMHDKMTFMSEHPDEYKELMRR